MELGRIVGVVELRPEGVLHLVVLHRGVLGRFSKRLAIPLDQVGMDRAAIRAPDVTLDQIERLPAYNSWGNADRELRDDEPVVLGIVEGMS